jgi:hypothetical protein
MPDILNVGVRSTRLLSRVQMFGMFDSRILPGLDLREKMRGGWASHGIPVVLSVAVSAHGDACVCSQKGFNSHACKRNGFDNSKVMQVVVMRWENISGLPTGRSVTTTAGCCCYTPEMTRAAKPNELSSNLPEGSCSSAPSGKIPLPSILKRLSRPCGPSSCLSATCRFHSSISLCATNAPPDPASDRASCAAHVRSPHRPRPNTICRGSGTKAGWLPHLPQCGGTGERSPQPRKHPFQGRCPPCR